MHESTSDPISLRHHDAYVEVVLSRPHVRNALDLDAWRRLAAVFEVLAAENPTVIVLRGMDGNLSSGSDIGQFPEHRTGMAAADEYNAAIDAALEAVGGVPHPVIAAISGLAVGGGCELACAADLRIAADNARFGMPIARLGVSVGEVEVRTMLRVLAPARLKDFLLTARLIDAGEAYRIGLVDRVVPAAELDGAVAELARTVAAGAPLAARANKLTVNAVADGTVDAVREQLRDLTAQIYEGQEFQEGIRAFVEKRPPRFGRADDQDA
jgi:enoyl-CoA hydratase